MAIDFDPSQDFKDILDQGQSLVLHRQNTSQSVAIDGARRFSSLHWPTQQSDGTARVHDVVWQFVWDNVSDLPRIGDQLTDALGTCWTIQQVEQPEANTRLRVYARDLHIDCWLSSRVDIQQAEYFGETILGWTTIYPAVPARIQPARTIGVEATEDDPETSLK